MPSEENQEFGNPAWYDYMTVASPSCHDTSTTRAWYEEDAERRERFFYLVTLLPGIGDDMYHIDTNSNHIHCTACSLMECPTIQRKVITAA